MNFRNLIRVSKPVTKLLGPQFTPSLNLIEIDITFDCNLKCYNCDRSCTQAPSNERMSIGQIAKFIEETKSLCKQWSRIRILGGEPLLHPNILEILEMLLIHINKESPKTILELVTNGHGEVVNKMINNLPDGIKLNNTEKKGRFQEKFEPFNLAMSDERKHFLTDYQNRCWIPEYCGIGLNKYGYYVCAVGGSIDRVEGSNIGLRKIPQSIEEFEQQSKDLCKLCGHFQFRRFTPIDKRKPVNGEPKSSTWILLYDKYNEQSVNLTDY